MTWILIFKVFFKQFIVYIFFSFSNYHIEFIYSMFFSSQFCSFFYILFKHPSNSKIKIFISWHHFFFIIFGQKLWCISISFIKTILIWYVFFWQWIFTIFKPNINLSSFAVKNFHIRKSIFSLYLVFSLVGRKSSKFLIMFLWIFVFRII